MHARARERRRRRAELGVFFDRKKAMPRTEFTESLGGHMAAEGTDDPPWLISDFLTIYKYHNGANAI
ncbi:hypothetical protein Y032_0055g2546 [Ancylostoma ceylanicum]|uniref:Uncharacterized protein n=1 Tax=Ancylostoma ceylanicum TaxID=53326 RepID=A0A016U732_9BILA|nr:hypothetical protein Y032_0055g2546 [Ancylostoma ceylanicum]